jgi:5-methyltetrahydropteroyltriglutamate--homocysteine methyltransferase
MRLSVNGAEADARHLFRRLGDNLETATDLPVHGLHIDLVRAPEQLDAVLAASPARPGAVARRDRRPQCLAADLDALLDRLEPVVAARAGP